MTPDPLRRRYGHGAARLRLGLAAGTPSFTGLANARVPSERAFAAVPGLVCVGLALLLAWAAGVSPSRSDRPRLALADAAEPLRIQLAPDRRPAPSRPMEHVPSPGAHADRAVPGRSTHADPPAPATQNALVGAATTDDGPARSRAAAPFDPKRLVPTGLDAPPTAAGAAPRTAHALDSGRPGRAPRSRLAASLARTPRRPQPHPAAPAPPTAPAARTHSAPARARDLDSEAAVVRSARGAVSGSTLAIADAAGPGRSAPPAPRPAVSTGPRNAALAAVRTDLDAGSRQRALDGWREVPLDTLPDCSPAGRQDRLKRRILGAAADRPECAHAGEAFRFVETRNLGAFLMWSRSESTASIPRARDRDACAVLERALRCLGASLEEESTRR